MHSAPRKVVRWTVPASLPCEGGWDFHLTPGTFDLLAGPVITVLRRNVAERRAFYDRFRKNSAGYPAHLEYPDEYRAYLNYIADLDWLTDAVTRSDLIVWDAAPMYMWWLASGPIYSGEWTQVRCPVCRVDYLPGSGRIVEWSFGSGLAAVGGDRYVCPAGHTLYANRGWNS